MDGWKKRDERDERDESVERRRDVCYNREQNEVPMKKLQVAAWITVLFLFVSMIMAVKHFQSEESGAFVDSVQYRFNGDWCMVLLEDANVRPLSYPQVQKQVLDALAAGKFQEVYLPYRGEGSAGDPVVFQTRILEQYFGLTLRFTSVDTAVCVYLDGNLLYQYGFAKDGTPEEDVQSREHTVEIPDVFEDGTLWIVQASSKPDAAAALGSVEFGTQESVVISVVGNNIADVGCCLLIMLMSFLLFVLALIRKYTRQPLRGEGYLGLVSAALGVSCFIATDALFVFYKIQEAYVMQEYLTLMAALFLAVYFACSLGAVYPRRHAAVVVSVVLSALLQLLLNGTGVRAIEEMVWLPALTLGAVCAAGIAGLIQFYRSRRYAQTLPAIFAVCALLFGGAADIVSDAVFGQMAYQYGVTLFAVGIAAAHILQLSREYRENVERTARILEEEIKVVEQQNVELALAKQDADAARHEALAANEAKGKFLAHMSHEIRTPINAVLGMDEMILREAKEPAIREYAMDIYTAGQTLLSLINDILDFSKIESGKMEIVPVAYDISSLIHDLANMTAQRAKNKDIKLEVQVDSQIPCQLYGDDVRIRQVLTNILTNAVKYTREGTVWLRVNCAQTDGIAALTFEVEDTGIGIRKEDLPKLSAEFERIEEDRNRNIEGTGLGMSITIQLLSLLGSRLQVESVYGKGSRFYFELKQEIVDQTPIGDFEARVQRIAEDYHYSARLCAPDAKILVVDDNAVNRRVLRGLLKETRIQVSEAESGAQCLALVQENHYDLIFLDHMMPEMDGVEVLHRIKALQDFPCQGTPVVVLTANAVSGAREHYLSEGFDDFLSKPIVPEKLENLIKKMLPEKLLAEAAPQEASASPAEILEEFPPVDGLDWQYAWMHLPDRELLEYTVKEFYAQIDSAADRLEQAYGGIIDAGQLAQYRIQVHAMKGLAATVGILPLSGVARLLESAAREGRLEVIASVTPVFLEEWRSYSRKLQGVFGIGSAVRTQINDTSVILALLEMLRLSMQELDIDKADQLMGQLQSYEYPKETKQSVRRLAEAVTNLDSAGADACVEALMEQFRSVETWTDSDSEERNAPRS